MTESIPALLILAGLYAMPSLIAFALRHPTPWLVANVNAWLGLTGIGWIVALLWALAPLFTRDKAPA